MTIIIINLGNFIIWNYALWPILQEIKNNGINNYFNNILITIGKEILGSKDKAD